MSPAKRRTGAARARVAPDARAEEERERSRVSCTTTSAARSAPSGSNWPGSECAARDRRAITGKLQNVDQLVDAAIISSTRITHDLRPGILDEGLVASLEWQARDFEHRMAIPCWFKASQDEIAVDYDSAIGDVSVLSGSARQHRQARAATRVDVVSIATDDAADAEVHDNGKGITVADMAKRSMLSACDGMKERAVLSAARSRSAASGDTTITLRCSGPPATASARHGATDDPHRSIADDHAMVRQGLRQILSAQPDFHVVAEAANYTEVMQQIRRSHATCWCSTSRMPGRTASTP